MSDSIKPMDIEGEAVCAVGPQLVTVVGEQGAGVDVKRTSSHLEADNLLYSDNEEPTDNKEQVKAIAHDKFAKTASAVALAWTSQNMGSLRKRAGAQFPQRSYFRRG